MPELRPYQEKGTRDVALKLSQGLSPVIYQLATGGGKTVTFATIADRYIKKSNQRVLILVHREELLMQTRRTLYDWYNLNSAPITPEARKLSHEHKVYVGMCETVHRRIEKVGFLPEFGLIIIDEAHLGNYKKIMSFFEKKLIIGFTATPISATKKDPLKNYYKDIVCGIDIPELISEGSLCQNETHRQLNVNRGDLQVVRGEFDEKQMSEEYSKTKHVKNTVTAYEKFLKGKKTIIFNCNISHSKLVNDAFIDAGYNSRHLDGNATPEYRREALRWLRDTPDAIINNVGILTTGFDEPSLLGCIVNKSVLSLPLWLQMTGRAGRTFPGKDKFIIVDMGDNALGGGLGDWSDPRNWQDLFHNPAKPKDKQGVAPSKECPECEAIIPASATTCKFCGYVFPPKEETYDAIPPEFVLLVKNHDVAQLVEKNQNYKEYYTFFQIGNNIATQAKYRLKSKILSEDQAAQLMDLYFEKANEWCKIKNKKFNQWHKDTAKKHLIEQLSKTFTWPA